MSKRYVLPQIHRMCEVFAESAEAVAVFGAETELEQAEQRKQTKRSQKQKRRCIIER